MRAMLLVPDGHGRTNILDDDAQMCKQRPSAFPAWAVIGNNDMKFCGIYFLFYRKSTYTHNCTCSSVRDANAFNVQQYTQMQCHTSNSNNNAMNKSQTIIASWWIIRAQFFLLLSLFCCLDSSKFVIRMFGGIQNQQIKIKSIKIYSLLTVVQLQRMP